MDELTKDGHTDVIVEIGDNTRQTFLTVAFHIMKRQGKFSSLWYTNVVHFSKINVLNQYAHL